jgi:hypothetical protein
MKKKKSCVQLPKQKNLTRELKSSKYIPPERNHHLRLYLKIQDFFFFDLAVGLVGNFEHAAGAYPLPLTRLIHLEC